MQIYMLGKILVFVLHNHYFPKTPTYNGIHKGKHNFFNFYNLYLAILECKN